MNKRRNVQSSDVSEVWDALKKEADQIYLDLDLERELTELF